MNILKKIKTIPKNLNRRPDKRELIFYHKKNLKLKLFLAIIKEFIFILKTSNLNIKSAQITFTFILAIVPFLSILFTFVHSIHGFENILTTTISPMINKHFGKEVGIQISDYLQKIIQNIEIKELGIISFVTFSITVIMLLLTIEDNFNEIMHYKNEKSVFYRFLKCWIIITISPFLFILTALKSDNLVQIIQFNFPHFIEGPIIKGTRLILGLSFQSLYFIFLYYVMPSKRLNFKSVLSGGVLASILFEILQYFNIFLAKRAFATDPSKIYGTVPLIAVLFFAWIRFSWIVTLTGASFSLATQRVLFFKKYSNFKDFPAKEIIHTIELYCSISKSYKEQGYPVELEKILTKTKINNLEALKIINYLVQKQIIFPTTIDQVHCYSPSYKALIEEQSSNPFLSKILFAEEFTQIKNYDEIEKYYILCLKGNSTLSNTGNI
jgi:membrane protein